MNTGKVIQTETIKSSNPKKIFTWLFFGSIAIVLFALRIEASDLWVDPFLFLSFPVYIIIGIVVIRLSLSHLKAKFKPSALYWLTLVFGIFFATWYLPGFLAGSLAGFIHDTRLKLDDSNNVITTYDIRGSNSRMMSILESAVQTDTFKIVDVHKNRIYFQAPYVDGPGYGTYSGIVYLPDTDPVEVESYLKENIRKHSYTISFRDVDAIVNLMNYSEDVLLTRTEEGGYLLQKNAENIHRLPWADYLQENEEFINEEGLINFVYTRSNITFPLDIPVELYENGMSINSKFKLK